MWHIFNCLLYRTIFLLYFLELSFLLDKFCFVELVWNNYWLYYLKPMPRISKTNWTYKVHENNFIHCVLLSFIFAPLLFVVMAIEFLVVHTGMNLVISCAQHILSSNMAGDHHFSKYTPNFCSLELLSSTILSSPSMLKSILEMHTCISIQSKRSWYVYCSWFVRRCGNAI